MYSEPDFSLQILALVIFRVLNSFIAIVPILFFRKVGVFHLLVFPFYLSLAKTLAQSPLSLLHPFLREGVMLQNTTLTFISKPSLVFLNLEAAVYIFLFKILLFVGYFAFRGRISIPVFRGQGRPNLLRFYVLTGIILAITFTFFGLQGGITSWISQWGSAGGRQEAAEGLGPVLRLIGSAYFLPLAWYLYRGKQAIKNPVFILLAIMTLFLGFATTGSRSSIVNAFIPFLVAYALLNRNLPIFRAFVFGAVFFFLFGLLGQIRKASTFNRGNFTWESINFQLQENVGRASAEARQWTGNGASIALYYSVPERVGYLSGLTYLGAISFWVPRAIWRDKPHGAGYYNGRLIFGGKAGIPPGAISEAFWNFGFLGILLMGFINGVLVSVFCRFFEANLSSVGAAVVYLIVLKTGLSISSLALTALFQTMIFVVLGLKYLRLL